MIYSKILQILYLPLVLPHLLAFITCKKAVKEKIKEDILATYLLGNRTPQYRYVRDLYKLLILCPEFRNVFYMRLGSKIRRILSLFLRPYKTLAIQDNCERIGGGFLVQHGNSTIVLANSIGKNFWVNQNVTVGWTEKGCPTIGDNVRIGTGAVVLGPIHIGDNVNIGAGAIVMKDVPSNTTVVSPMARIIKKDGKRVDIPLS